MSRNGLYLLLGAFIVTTVIIGYLLYKERQETTGIDIDVGKGSISIETK
jgi:hypothetical protein